MSTTTEIVKQLRENSARAKGYLRRDETLRAVELAASMLESYARITVVGSARFELEVNLDEVLAEISRQPPVRALLPTGPAHKPLVLKFIRGKENLLATALTRIAQGLQNQIEQQNMAEQRKREEHKQGLLRSGQECVSAGDMARARVFLHRVLEEYGASDPSVYAVVAAIFLAAELPLEAAVVYEMGIEAFPKEPERYSVAIDIYISMREYEKADQIFERVLRQFGTHPRTLLKRAYFYLEWRKKELAASTAYRALTLDSTLTEAKELLDTLDGKTRAGQNA